MLKVLNRDLEWAGIEKTQDGKTVHLHACRHSYITLLARSGMQPHILKKLARHSKTDMTLSVYTHIVHGDESLAVENLPNPDQNDEIVESKATGTNDTKPHVRLHVQNWLQLALEAAKDTTRF